VNVFVYTGVQLAKVDATFVEVNIRYCCPTGPLVPFKISLPPDNATEAIDGCGKTTM
jgi:hypothetical protein